MALAWPGGDLREMPPTRPAETRQGDGALLKAEANVDSHGTRAAGRRPAGDVSDWPAENRRDSVAPLEMEASTGDPDLWAEDRSMVGRLLMEAHYLETVWQDCPANERLAAEYFRNVL